MEWKIDDLEVLESALWKALAAAPNELGNPWRLPVLATADVHPDARTVVLREVDPTGRSLGFHTDARSPKIQQLHAGESTVTFVFWDPEKQMQLRAYGEARIHRNSRESAQAWEALNLRTREQYYGKDEPGRPRETPGASPLQTGVRGTENFALVRVAITRMDWLLLHSDGEHSRAVFDSFRGSHWVTP